MDLALLVYGISVMSKLSVLLFAVVVISVIVMGISMLVRVFHIKETWHSSRDNEIYDARRSAALRVAKWSAGVFLGASIISALIPSEKTAYTMVGAYAAQKVAENENVQRISGKVLAVIEQKLDTYIQEGVAKVEKADKK